MNKIINNDCMIEMKCMNDDSVDFTLTDIPYNEVSRNSICVFCGREQFSEIYKFFANKKGTTRPIVWEKSNPSPMNGQHIYLSGVENAIWFKKRGGTFNAHCKNTVFKYPIGRSKLHPTEKIIYYYKN